MHCPGAAAYQRRSPKLTAPTIAAKPIAATSLTRPVGACARRPSSCVPPLQTWLDEIVIEKSVANGAAGKSTRIEHRRAGGGRPLQDAGPSGPTARAAGAVAVSAEDFQLTVTQAPAIRIASPRLEALAKTLGIPSVGRMQGVHTRLFGPLIHLRTHADETKGGASRGVIGKASRRVSKIATRGVTNLDTIGHRIGTLCWRLRTARSGERIANPRAATPATVAGHPESRSN
jgi:hypothetical protein